MSVKQQQKKKRAGGGNPVWADVVADLNELAATAKGGGMAAVAAKYKVTRVPAAGPPAVAAGRIAEARQAVGLSQPQFAAGLGVSAALVKAWEQGLRTPAPAVRLLLADVAERPDYWRPKLAAG